MFASLLVANRAEIACRIFRTARAMGMRCIGVHSEVDAKARHVREADESVLIGPAAASESYLRGDRIIEAAKRTGAEAIHPGYGFLSENPDFAEAVIEAGLVWVGPTPASIRAMGLKDEAKRIAEDAGVPVVPGYRGESQDARTLAKAAKEIGFPVLIKAVAGGGGRGIREVHAQGQFGEALASARREAAAAFGDDRVIVEKLIERPRHIEVQVFGDKHGNLVHMFERDCSLQRRRQKVIEEAPAPGMTEEVRAAMTDAALKVARAVNYENAGTVEFIVDGSGPLRPDGFWFLEMNTRLQVEHPVTEAVTGLDLVEWQLRVAAGEKLPCMQNGIMLADYGIEARIAAEDPYENFRPSSGRLRRFMYDGLTPRMDLGFVSGDLVPAEYDSLLGKMIEHRLTRHDAIYILASFIGGLQITGVRSNAGFLRRCLLHQRFIAADVHTGFIDEEAETLAASRGDMHRAAILMAASQIIGGEQNPSPWAGLDGWRLNTPPRRVWRFEYSGKQCSLEIVSKDTAKIGDAASPRIATATIEAATYHLGYPGFAAGRAWIVIDEESEGAFVEESAGSWTVHFEGDAFEFEPYGASREHADGRAGDDVRAPLPGKVVALSAMPGAAVKKGDVLITLEAMKMEHALKAPRDGTVAEIAVKPGAQVKEGMLLVRLEEEAE